MTVALCMALGAVGAQGATLAPTTLGDTTYESVYGNATAPKLTTILSNAGLTIGGNPIDVGDVDAGSNPATSDQTQWQMFVVTGGSLPLRLEYLGGEALYNNTVGIFSAPLINLGNITYTPVFYPQNHDPVGTVRDVTIPSDSVFGFYIDPDRDATKRLFSVNAWNDDNKPHNVITDHFLIFEADQAMVVAIEDLPYKPSTGKLGDQDYNDVVFRVNIIPEPASLGLLGLGALGLVIGQPRRRQA